MGFLFWDREFKLKPICIGWAWRIVRQQLAAVELVAQHRAPLGATGVRLTGTLARILEAKSGRYGCANACVGGGQGGAMLIERVTASGSQTEE